MGIITMIVIGLVAGLIARAIVPGRQSMGVLATMLLGIVGSFVGGLLGSLFSRDG
ncbi:MAG TPA: GlsB/YeaQ/YmgE family stress response membrane protein, partial [Myxococcaceae bacterium]|nr:GlsB/YeaQ/YmgE family stress response membrane protein [Myxococcaceae bacterium]